MARYLYCRNCARATAVSVDRHDRCLGCGGAIMWRDTSEDPQHDWKLSGNDKRFLQSLRIKADDAAP